MNMISKKSIVLVALSFAFLASFSTVLASAPVISTNPVSNITSSGATLSGEILNNGGQEVTSVGFQYGPNLSYGTTVNVTPTFSYGSQFGSTGSNAGQFSYPWGISIDNSGNIYVNDSNNSRVEKFNSAGVFQSEFGGWGNGNGQFSTIAGIDFDSLGNIYVADISTAGAGTYRVEKFNSSGVYQSQFSTTGYTDTQLTPHRAIAIDSANNVYLVDNVNNKIKKFNSAGVFQSEFGGTGSQNGQFNFISAITVDSSDNLYVVDRGNSRVEKFNSAGVYVSQFGSYGSLNNQFITPVDITVDSFGNIYVLQESVGVKKFNSNYVYQTSFNWAFGSGNGQFGAGSAEGIAVSNSGDIFLVDSMNNRIQKFSKAHFSADISNLVCGKGYHVRAFGTNSDGTSYGSDVSFFTLECQRPILVKPVSLKPSAIIETANTLDAIKKK